MAFRKPKRLDKDRCDASLHSGAKAENGMSTAHGTSRRFDVRPGLHKNLHSLIKLFDIAVRPSDTRLSALFEGVKKKPLTFFFSKGSKNFRERSSRREEAHFSAIDGVRASSRGLLRLLDSALSFPLPVELLARCLPEKWRPFAYRQP